MGDKEIGNVDLANQVTVLSYLVTALGNSVGLGCEQYLIFELQELADGILYLLIKLPALKFNAVGHLALLVARSVDLRLLLAPVKDRDFKSHGNKLSVIGISVNVRKFS